MSLFSQNNDTHYTDEVLLEMLRSEGDAEWALEQIFGRYHMQMFKLATGVLRDEDLAKDLVQEIFIDLWNRKSTSNIQGLSHYLFRAIKFQVLKQLRNGKLRDHHLKILRKVEFINQTEELLNFKELEKIINDRLNQLPPRCKEVFYLSRFENLSNKEISDRLQISIKTVEGQITKALSFLRTVLDKTILLLMALLNY
jgi:RNA polymerase sigma-70 factor (family 1)